ncbi:MAG TPA: DNA methyltransferase [Candidatus Paceibacterota bacterium]|nr:DNA methyltransferase [Candidatus Paceibacterota bacterium]
MAPRDRLRSLSNFADLIRYLEEELAWPLQQYGFDELTFAYEADELGLREEDAAKVRKIHQLRPLASGQPWGIFFIEFEKKRLPVVVLRRILSMLVVKKRASANKSERAAWQPEDLLFVSALGDETTDQREIAFAHFHQESGDLPTLRVLGWDGGDTPLKLEHVDATLHDKLRWPADPRDLSTWRAQWTRAFRHRVGHVIRTADGLAERLAALARGICAAAQTMMAHETERGALTKLYKAFQTALIHDLTPESFADTYAQTITYGLLTAAISRTEMSAGTAGTFVRAEDVSDIVPVTNPFLKEMLQTFLKAGGRKGGIDFDELGIQDVVELLRGDETDLPAILRDFGNKNPDEDPVIHFYEHFLSAYNKKLKVQRGVFYTPPPVVSYIVRSVHELLQTEFGLADGLASTVTWGEMVKRNPELKLPPLTDEPDEKRAIDPGEFFVQILDIATGTATFVVEVIDVVHRHLKAQWDMGGLAAMPRIPSPAGAGEGGAPAPGEGPGSQPSTFNHYWNVYVPVCLLPRLYGFELMMAPYAIAHMKVGLKLYETGYRFGSAERVRIYLTNTLEPKVRQLPQIGFDALAHEAAAVNEIKWYKRFTVVVGNPPYAGISSNMTDYAQRIVDAYKTVDGSALKERKLWLQDDYVKFIRKAQTTVESARVGILGCITNHGYLDNPTFRGMRQSLMATFPQLRLLDLHGNSNKKEQCPDGSEDKNVFDIRQGVAICLATRGGASAAVAHANVWGSRQAKYAWLATHRLSDTVFSQLIPDSPFYFFEPQVTDWRAEYDAGWKTTDIFTTHGVGVVMARDSMTVDFSAMVLWERVIDFASLPAEKARAKYELGDDARDWRVETAQADIQASGPNEQRICAILYRPFDIRFTYYTGNSRGFYASPCRKVMSNMLAGNNRGLALSRSVEIGQFDHVFCTKGIIGHHSVSLKEVNYLFPLWLEPAEDAPEGLLMEDAQRQPNLAPPFLRALAKSLSLKHTAPHGLPSGISAEDIFHYTYAVFHSPGYRSRYAEFLKIDFPRLPLTGSLELFRALAQLGGELVALHLLESPKLDHPITEYLGGRASEIEKVSWSNDTVWLDKAQTTGFRGVPQPVWSFHIGGYQVCEKWLKDRKGRALSADDIAHYQKVVVALSETIRLMAEIDAVVGQYGGWPLK